MSVKFVYAKAGYRFYPTQLGFEQAKIRNKYDENSTSRYNLCVPSKWVEKGWVKEVKNVG